MTIDEEYKRAREKEMPIFRHPKFMGTIWDSGTHPDYVAAEHWTQVSFDGFCEIREDYYGERMRTDYLITLRMDVDPSDEEIKKHLIDAVRSAAQILYTQAVMVAAKRKPEVALHWENSYEGKEKILLFNPDEDLADE